jgi:hypothetical protein
MTTNVDLAAYPAQQFAQAPSAQRTRALLFLTGNEGPLRRLERHDSRIRHHTTVTRAAWSGGLLRVDLAITLFERLGRGPGRSRRRPVVFRALGGEIERVLSDKIVHGISEGAQSSFPATVDVTDELPRTGTFVVLHRPGTAETTRIDAVTRLDARIPTGGPDLFTPRFTATLEIAPDQAGLLADRRFERYTVVDAIGLRTVEPLPSLRRELARMPAEAGQALDARKR